jgi:hypothetical protein
MNDDETLSGRNSILITCGALLLIALCCCVTLCGVFVGSPLGKSLGF